MYVIGTYEKGKIVWNLGTKYDSVEKARIAALKRVKTNHGVPIGKFTSTLNIKFRGEVVISDGDPYYIFENRPGTGYYNTGYRRCYAMTRKGTLGSLVWETDID